MRAAHLTEIELVQWAHPLNLHRVAMNPMLRNKGIDPKRAFVWWNDIVNGGRRVRQEEV